MILADIKLPRIDIPDHVKQASRHAEVDVYRHDVPFDNAVWIACPYVWPHTDDSREWKSQMFLTLSVKSEHTICDQRTKYDEEVPAGRLFVVDPVVRHWLCPREAWMNTRVHPWIGLQWEVPRRRAKQVARDIVRTLGGRWLDTDDKRYADWRDDR